MMSSSTSNLTKKLILLSKLNFNFSVFFSIFTAYNYSHNTFSFQIYYNNNYDRQIEKISYLKNK